jgi:hypothetical protein
MRIYSWKNLGNRKRRQNIPAFTGQPICSVIKRLRTSMWKTAYLANSEITPGTYKPRQDQTEAE